MSSHTKESEHRETEAFLREVDALLRVYGDDNHGNQEDPLDELVFILLSAQTEAYLYRKTYQNLTERYDDWTQLMNAPEDEVERSIRHGGLSRKKARQLKGAMQKIFEDRGRLSLGFLRDMPLEDATRYLTSLPGIGVKGAKCILMYSLSKPVFPVDTHVWRVSRRLGLTPPVPKPSDRQERELEQSVPEDLRYRLHVNMVSHGRQTCTTYRPKCGECVLAHLCPSKDLPDVVWNQWRQPKGVWGQVTVTTPEIRSSKRSRITGGHEPSRGTGTSRKKSSRRSGNNAKS